MKERNSSLLGVVKKLPKPLRYGIYGSLTAAGIAGAGAGVAFGARAAISELRGSGDDSENLPRVEREIESRNFLELPFPQDPNMRIQQGWIEEGGDEHKGIDYIKGAVDRSATWQQFPVLSAASGRACANPPRSIGNAVWIEHNVAGENFYTYYGHLADIEDNIPECQDRRTVQVRRGEQIGISGSTGVSNPRAVHLHFEVKNRLRQPIDPYDLRAKRAEYPDPNLTNGKICGENHLWINCPTENTVGAEPTATPESTILGENLFADPSFEAVDSLSGSGLSNWESYLGYSIVDKLEAHSGNQSLRVSLSYRAEDIYAPPGECGLVPVNSGFFPKVPISINPGVYEIGMWVKARSTTQSYISVGMIIAGHLIDIGPYPDFPTDWTRFSKFIQVPDGINPVQPLITLSALPTRLRCENQTDIWFDDVFLIPVSSEPTRVYALPSPQTEIEFFRKLEEESQPLLERAKALGRLEILSPALEEDKGYYERLQAYLRAVNFLVFEYEDRVKRSPGVAVEFLNLAKDLCKMIEENFPENIARFRQFPRPDVCNNLK